MRTRRCSRLEPLLSFRPASRRTVQASRLCYIFYFDLTSAGKATEVKFAAGHKVAVKHRGSLLGIAATPKELAKDKLKVDSDKALSVALAEPLLKILNVKATRLILEEWEGMPVWKVRLWAAKLQKPEEMTDIGDVFVDAQEGKVIRSDLKIKRVD